MAVKQVSVPDIGIVHLYKRRGTKGLRLSISSQGTVRVSLPPWLPYKTALDFVARKKEWIAAQQIEPIVIMHGSRVGKAHHVVFAPDTSRTSIATRITTTGEIRIHHPAHLTAHSQPVQAAAHKASIRALKAQAEKLLPVRLETLAMQHDFTYQAVRIKRLSSRWGSCSDQQSIALSCFLMQLPWHLIDYVLLHELVHTRIMAHGPVFWQELGRYVPRLKAVRKEIKAYRPVLIIQ